MKLWDKNKIKLGDYVIVAVILMSAILIFMFFLSDSNPDKVIIKVNGVTESVYSLPLYGEYELNTLPYPSTLVIEGSFVHIKDTTCPGHDCEHRGKISRSGDIIICLPNFLTIELEGGGRRADAVTQ